MAKNIKSSRELAKNDAYRLEYEEYLDDIKSAGIVLRHKKSGARICLISNDDENKMFCAAFRTPPTDSTGVPHIIEHSVLNGSKHYPSRDPFMQLIKGSLNTFLNAMTYPDKTMYPVASCNDKDFINLMNVYMDAVFYPNIYERPQIFQQEGWHYEMEDPADELKINGVVYSEMKGAMSSPDRMIWDRIAAHIYPDTTYGVNSGGDPTVIPDLTYEAFLDFHREHYHPSNAYIFLYGDCDMDERLRWMDENYLSAFDTIEPHTEVEKQPRFDSREPKRVVESYSVGSEDETEGKAFLAYSALGGSGMDAFECRAWGVLSDVLVYSDGAPVKRALLEAGIGEDVFGGYDSHMLENSFSIIAKNAKEGDLDRFYTIILDTLAKEVENGISERSLLACINRMEFSFREADYGGYPKGLDYASTMLLSWLYDDGAAFSYMHTLDDFAELKKRIGTGYYEGLVKKYVLDTDHAVLLKLIPKRGLMEEEENALREKLAAYKASLSEEEIAKIVEDTKGLRAYQEADVTEEEKNCIPSLQRSDIPVETVPLTNREGTVGGCPAVFHDVETSGITYLKLRFDIGKIPHRYVPYVGLMGYILGRMSTKSHSFEELEIEKKLNTGSLSFWHYTARKYGTMDDYRPMYSVNVRMLAEHVPAAMELIREILTETDLGDKARLWNILTELRSDKKREIMNSGNSVASARAVSYFSRMGCYTQALEGIDFYLFLCDLTDHYDERWEDLAANLKKVAAILFDPDRMIASVAADEAGVTALDAALPGLCDALRAVSGESLGAEEEYVPVKKNEAILIPSQVQYMAMAGNLGFDGMAYHGAMQVVKTAVNVDWLYQQIRVKGGAYGCGCAFDGDSNNVRFSSYRDPKVKETLDAFRGTGDFVRTVKFDEADLTKYIIGTFSAYERPMSPAGKASRSFDAYLSGLTYENIVARRREMLGITEAQFRSAADAFDAICRQGCTCAVGSETRLRENRDLFDTLVTIQ